MPNRLGVPGEDLPHVSHYYREPHPLLSPARRHRRRQELRGRGGARALPQRRANVLLVHRGAALGESIKYWVKPDIENRIKEGSIRGALRHARRRDHAGRRRARRPGRPRARAGGRTCCCSPATARTRRCCARPAPTIDRDRSARPSTTPRRTRRPCPNLFVIGAFVAGQQSGRIFIENGRFHGEVVVKEIAKQAGVVVDNPHGSEFGWFRTSYRWLCSRVASVQSVPRTRRTAEPVEPLNDELRTRRTP